MRQSLLRSAAALILIVGWAPAASGADAVLVRSPGSNLKPRNDVGDPAVNVALQWNDAAVTALKNSKTPVTVGARILAIAHTAMYDAWAPYDPTAVASLPGGAGRQPQSQNTVLNKSSAVTYAAYGVLMALLPSQAAAFNTLMVGNLDYDPGVTATSGSNSAAIGNLAAALQLAAHKEDGANQLGDQGAPAYADYTGYQPINTPDLITDPNRWQPLRNADGSVQTFLTPFWGQVKPFALQSASQFRPAQPPQAGNWLYLQRMRDALQQNSELDDMSKMSAEYWEDATGSETSVGHWNRIAEEISNRDQHSLDLDVQMFFALNAAELDTSIAVWDAKRFYDSIRPVSVIRYYLGGQMLQNWVAPGQNSASVAGSNWSPWIPTPPYPDFPSDKSGFAAAGAEILKLFTGNDVYLKQVSFAAGSSVYDRYNSPSRAVTLGWFTYSQIAENAQWSTGPGGVHFEDAELQGSAMGRSVADVVWGRYSQLLSGVR
jgi:hypothetical protein